jgi:hypothetical protein
MGQNLRGLGFKRSYLRITFWQRHAFRIIVIGALGLFLAVCLINVALP